MRNKLILLMILVAGGLPAAPEPIRTSPKIKRTAESSGKNQTVASFDGRISRQFQVNYLVHLPRDYRTSKESRWPLIIFLHGAGERGMDPSKVKVHGPPKLAEANPDFPFVVVSPQCPTGEWWEVQVLNELLDHVLKTYRADDSRVYLTGLSMGGFGSWAWSFSNPERFAAVAPICGGGQPVLALLLDKKRQQALKQLPVWAFHGAKDPVVPLDESERMVNSLKRMGNTPKLTVYPEATHDSWTETYSNPELYQWFLQHRRNPVVLTPQDN